MLNKIVFTLLLLLSTLTLYSQVTNVSKGAAVIYTNGQPSGIPRVQYDSEWAIDITTSKIWRFNRTNSVWVLAGSMIGKLNSTSAPTVAPKYGEPDFIINNSNLIYWYNSSTWNCLNCASVPYTAGTGISIGSNVITNTAPDQTVVLTGAGITAISGTYPNFTITSTEVDGSTTNEIQQIDSFVLSNDTLYLSLSSDGVPQKFVVLTGLSASSGGGIYGVSDTVTYHHEAVIDSGITFLSDKDSAYFDILYDLTVYGAQARFTPDSLTLKQNDIGGTNRLDISGNGINLFTTSPDRVTIRGNDARYYSDLRPYDSLSITHKDYNDDTYLQYVDTFRVSNDTLYISLFNDSIPQSFVVLPEPGSNPQVYDLDIITPLPSVDVEGSIILKTVDVNGSKYFYASDGSNWIPGGLFLDTLNVLTIHVGNNQITYAKMQQATAQTLLGNPTGSTANVSEITLGTGLNFSGTTLVNSSPDQTVVLNNGTGISISGTYPNFTITNTSTNTDAQTLSWNGSNGELSISGGNTVDLDGRYLQSEVDGSTTNEIQRLDTFEIVSNTLRASLLNDGVPFSSVDLSPYLDNTDTSGYNFSFTRSNDTLFITDGDGTLFVKLPADINTDEQELTIDSVDLTTKERFLVTIDNGNTIAFDVDYNTDGQTLSVDSTDIGGTIERFEVSISNGNSIFIDVPQVAGLGGGQNNIGANLGAGTGIYAGKTDTTLNFKSLVEGYGIDITNTSTEITLKVDTAQIATLYDVAVVQADIDAHEVADGDLSATNEIQNLSVGGTGPYTIDISSGTGITINNSGIITLTESPANTLVIGATEVDGSVTNEIQTIDTFEIVSNVLRLSLLNDNLPFSSVNLSSYLDNTDAQNLTIEGSGPTYDIAISGGTDVTLSGGGIVTLSESPANTLVITATEVDGSVSNEGSLTVAAGTSTTSVINSNTSGQTGVTLEAAGILTISETGNTITLTGTEVDGSTTNEIQDLSLTGSGPYTIDLSSTSNDIVVSAGTGIGLSESPANTLVITNSAPDQTVTLNNGTGISISGTYPTFTITNSSPNVTTDLTFTGSGPYTLNSSDGTDVTFTQGTGMTLTRSSNDLTITNAAPDQTVVLNEGTGIDVTGTYPNFTITNTVTNTDAQNLTIEGAGPTYDIAISGGSDVTVQGGGIVTLSESPANTLVITATEVDGSTTNEIQNVSYTASTRAVAISGGGTGFTFPTFSTSGTDAGLVAGSNGATTNFLRGDNTWQAVITTEVDGSTSNELQDLSITGSSSPFTLDISGSSNDVNFSAGTGISLSESPANTLVITNSAPDQTVTLTEGSNVTITGTYPNFTIAATPGAGVTDLTFTGASSPYTLNSSTGTDVTFAEGSGITLSRSSNELTITATDASITNEAWTVDADGGDTEVISNQTLLFAGAGIASTSYNATSNTLTITATEVDGSTSNELQTIANTSDATSHTVTLSNSGGTIQFIEGTNISLTTGGTSGAGTLTIASSVTDTDDQGLTIGGSGPTYTIDIDGGSSVTIAAAGITTLSESPANTLVITSTEVDGSISNEGSLTVAAGSSTTSIINSNTSGQTGVTIEAAGILTISESGNTITITGTEVDGSVSNELQTYGHAGTTTYTNTLSNGGGSWSITGAGIAAISQTGGAITVTATEVDGSITNEIQDLSLTGTGPYVIDISSSSNDVTVSAGTGISLSESPANTLVVTNSAPDQTVSLTNGGGISVSGTYPSFTLTATDQSTTNEAWTIDGDDADTEVISNQTVKFQGAGITTTDYNPTTDVLLITSTEVDGSVSNEGSLTVGAGGGNSSTIVSNTSGSTAVTLEGGANITITESGSTITIAASSGSGTDLTFTGESSPYTLNSSSGTDVTFASGTGISISRSSNELTIASTVTDTDDQNLSIGGTGPTYTLDIIDGTGVTVSGAGIITLSESPANTLIITGTEVDGSVSNEGSLTVGAGTGTTSIINSNTSGSTAVTIEAGTGLSTSESGGTITLVNTGDTDGTNDIVQNGNTFGAAVTIGSNDANAVNLEVNNVTGLTLGTDYSVTATASTASTNTIENRLLLRTNSAGTAAAGFGGRLLFQGESSTTDNQDMIGLTSGWSTATHPSRVSYFGIETVSSGGALTERVRFDASAMTINQTYTLGNSSSTIQLGASPGLVNIFSSASNSSAIKIYTATSATNGSVNFGNAASFTNTSGTKTLYYFSDGFAPISGTGIFNTLSFTNTFNQTGGANGITRSIFVNPTLTAVADHRALEIGVNTANAKAIYQSGTSSVNNLAGNTRIGSVSAPARTLDVTGELRVSDLTTDNPTVLVGADADGDFAGVTLGSGFSFSGTTLNFTETGSGTVTNFSAGDLAPLFTTSEANTTTTPALSFALTNADANTYFGNATGSSAAPSYISAGALTRTDDTNVTLTLGGNPATSLLRDASLTLGWTGQLAVSRGGTGAGSLTGLLQGNGTSPVTAITNSSTVGQVLRVTGASTYAWGALDLADGDAITGNLPVANLNGGTSASATTFWRGDGTWATPAGVTDLTIGGTGPTYTIESSTGTDVTISGAGIITLSESPANTLIITGTEVDGSVSNEGSLTVGAGSGTTSTIVSNTSGSTAVTIEASTGLSISESGSTITLTNTGDTNAADDITGSGASGQVAYFNGTQTVTGDADFTFNGAQIGIGTSPSSSHRLYVKQSTTNDGIFIERSSSSAGFRLYQDAASYIEGTGNMVMKTTGGTITLEPPGGSAFIAGVTIVPTAAKTDTFAGSTFLEITGTYSPTLASTLTGFPSLIRLGTTINQTSGANQPMNGLFIDPTLTAAPNDFRGVHYRPSTHTFLWQPSGDTVRSFIRGKLGIGPDGSTPAYRLDVKGTDGIRIPVGTTANRPTGATGVIRYNTDSTGVEYYNGSTWLKFGSGGGSDGNGIYTGSGTIASNAVATITSGQSFTIDWNGGSNALSFDDATGSFFLADKTFGSYVSADNTQIGLTSGSDSYLLSETSGGSQFNHDIRVYNGHISLDAAITPSQITANQNNYNPTGLSTTSAVRLSSDASREITGLTVSGSFSDGRIIMLYNVGSFDIVLKNENVNSTAANRFAFDADITLSAGQSITLWYDTTSDRWRSVSKLSSGAGTIAWNSITAPTGNLTLAHGSNTTAFTFNSVTSSSAFGMSSSSLSSGILLDLSVASTAAASNSQTVLNVATSGANATSSQSTFASSFLNTHTGTSSVNYAVYASASGASTNYAVYTNNGSVRIGDLTSSGNTLVGATSNGLLGEVTVGDGLSYDGSAISGMFITAAPSSNTTVSGEKIQFTANENQAFGDVVYIASDGDATLADADGIATAKVVAMCTATVTTGNTATYLLKGIARNDSWNWTVGGYVYLSTTGTTGNTLTQTAPSGTDDCVVIVGIATHADRILVNPSQTIVEIK